MAEPQWEAPLPTKPELFDTFAANLALYRKNRNGLFRCPLCLRKFSRDHIDGEDGLSEAHTIPRSLGGEHWTLACRKCNSTVGSEIGSCEVGKHGRATFGDALTGNTDKTVPVQIWFENERGAVVGPLQPIWEPRNTRANEGYSFTPSSMDRTQRRESSSGTQRRAWYRPIPTETAASPNRKS